MAQGKVQTDPLLTKNFLDSGLMQVALLPVEKQREIKTRIAEGYVGLARLVRHTAKIDAYLILQTARGLYSNSGIGKEDKRIGDINAIIHSSFGNKKEIKAMD